MTKENNIIFLISNEPWGDIWYSKQHYANELSANNYVFFVNPPTKWKFPNLFSFVVSTKKISDSLTVVNYQNNFPMVFILKSLTRWLNDLCNSYKLKKVIEKTRVEKNIVFWQFDPFRFIHIFLFKNKKRIYHVVDPYMSVDTDKTIALNSDLIISISSRYIEHYKKLNKNVILIPHGISKDEIITDTRTIEEIRKKFGDFVLLIGTINDQIDLHLLKKIVISFPENNLVIIGPPFLKKIDDQQLFESLIKYENIKYLSAIHAKKLNNYIAASHVCILNYYADENGFCNRTPLKISNYIAQKKMIISSTFFYDIIELNNKIIYMARKTDEFLNYLKSAIDNNLYYDSKLAEKYIEQMNYEKLINTIFTIINNLK